MAKSAGTIGAPARAPGQHWYFLAAAIVLIGWGAMEATLYLRSNAAVERMIRTVAPGETELSLEDPGIYTIFHEYHSVIDGHVYAVDGVSELIINVRPRAGGGPLALNSAVGLSYNTGDKAGRALFAFEVTAPGSFQLAASYGDGRREPQTVIAVAHDFVKDRATTTFIAEACGFGSIAIGAFIALMVFRRRRLVAKSPQQVI